MKPYVSVADKVILYELLGKLVYICVSNSAKVNYIMHRNVVSVGEQRLFGLSEFTVMQQIMVI